jgi:hypothetical protein
MIRGEKEPLTPRICVSRTIAGCFSAVLFQPGPVFVYRTVKRLAGVKPVGTFDALVTDERWIVHPAEFEIDRVILPCIVERAQQAAVLWHRETRKASALSLKVCQRAIAARVLGGPTWEEDLCERWMRTLGIEHDPEEHLLLCAIHKSVSWWKPAWVC